MGDDLCNATFSEGARGGEILVDVLGYTYTKIRYVLYSVFKILNKNNFKFFLHL
jgi:hypothetical protein